MAPFDERCRAAAEWIRGGGLVDPDPMNSQVAADLHGVLADINALGFVTIDSQEGGDKWERAYVNGFMRGEDATAFIERFNCTTDCLAIKLLPTHLTRRALQDLTSQAADPIMRSYIPVTRMSKGAPRSVTRTPLYMPTPEHRFLQTHAGIDATERVVLVVCIDMTWGHRATARAGLLVQVRKALRGG